MSIPSPGPALNPAIDPALGPAPAPAPAPKLSLLPRLSPLLPSASTMRCMPPSQVSTNQPQSSGESEERSIFPARLYSSDPLLLLSAPEPPAAGGEDVPERRGDDAPDPPPAEGEDVPAVESNNDFLARVAAGRVELTADKFPSFLYEDGSYDSVNLDNGLLREWCSATKTPPATLSPPRRQHPARPPASSLSALPAAQCRSPLRPPPPPPSLPSRTPRPRRSRLDLLLSTTSDSRSFVSLRPDLPRGSQHLNLGRPQRLSMTDTLTAMVITRTRKLHSIHPRPPAL
ncbi:hypothetical protein DFH09DRAFT_1096055 [Mycena vulgaris]|nr:hypothetical protein DFH09DRAFT_1096055 [Mycena vulgaris]